MLHYLGNTVLPIVFNIAVWGALLLGPLLQKASAPKKRGRR